MSISSVFRARRFSFHLLGLLVAVLTTAAASSTSQAQSTATWNGGGASGDWSTSSNWISGIKPTTSGSWALVFGGTTQTTGTNTIGTVTTSSLSFTNDGSAGKTAVFTLSGSTLALSSAVITTSATSGGSLAATGDAISNAMTLAGANTVTLGAGHSLSLTAGGISGTGSITYGVSGGDATVYLSGSNSYSGGTTITGGQVRTAAAGGADGSNNFAFGTGGVVVSGSGSAVLRNGTTLGNDFSIGGIGLATSGTLGAIRGSFSTSSRSATVAGSVTLSANATITTAASNGVTNSKLVLSGPVSLGTSTLTLAPDLGVTNATSSAIVISGTVTGAGSVVVVGGTQSSVLLSANNSYSGGTTLTSGTLSVGAGSALGTGVLAVNGGVLDLNGQSLGVAALSSQAGGVIRSSVAGPASITTTSESNTTLAGAVTDGAGVVSLFKAGGGTIFASGSNSYSGGTTITGGQIRTSANGASDGSNDYAFGTGAVVVSGSGSAVLRNGTTLANNFTIGGEGLSTSGTQGAIRGSFSTSDRTATVAGAVTLSANATIVTAANSGVTGSKLVLGGPIHLGANTLTFRPGSSAVARKYSDNTAVPIVVTGTMSGTGDVIIDGASAVYMNGRNASSGGTIVRSGALSGDGVIDGLVTVESGATIAPGNAANTTGALHVGGLMLNSGATAEMMISGASASLYDQIIATNNVTFGGSLAIEFTQAGFPIDTVWQLFSGAGYSGSFTSISMTGSYGSHVFSSLGNGEWQADLGNGQSMLFFENNNNTINGMFSAGQLVLVPEPSTIAIAGVGIFVIGLTGLRKRRSAGCVSGRPVCVMPAA